MGLLVNFQLTELSALYSARYRIFYCKQKLAFEAFLTIKRAAIFGRWRRRCKAQHLWVDQHYAGQQACINLIRGYI
jgi:hypothetical protein